MTDTENSLAEKHRRKTSLDKFGHPNATWAEISQHNNEEARKRFSMEKFGHPNASWSEINRRENW